MIYIYIYISVVPIDRYLSPIPRYWPFWHYPDNSKIDKNIGLVTITASRFRRRRCSPRGATRVGFRRGISVQFIQNVNKVS